MNKNNLKKLILVISILFLLSITLSSANAVNVTINPGDAGGVNSAVSTVASGSDVNNTITLNPGTYNKSTDRNNNITFNGKNLTIQGNGPTGSVIIDAQKLGRLFSITGNSNITFINITFLNGNITGIGNAGSGGAISKTGAGMLDIINCRFNDNTADSVGGAIFINSGNSNISDSNFTNNTAQSGGAIYNNVFGGSSSIKNSIFTNNTASSTGGAIDNRQPNNKMNITNSTFNNNEAFTGGALHSAQGSIYVISSSFLFNSATNGAVGYTNNNGYLNISYSRIVNNTNPIIQNGTGTVVLDYNWWGSNDDPNSQILNGTVNNYFVMNVTNLTSTVTNGSAVFNYTFGLNTNEAFDPSLLPYFVTNVYTNITSGIQETFDARFNRTVTVDTNRVGQNVTYTFVTDNEVKNISLFVESTSTNLEVNNPSGRDGDTVDLIARLTDADGNPIAGKLITFHVGSMTLTAITDANGIATVQYTINADDFTDGQLTFTAIFEGDENYSASTATGIITLIEEPPIPPEPPTPTPENETNETSENPTAISQAAMKKTGIPINIILLVLLSVLSVLISRKQN